MSSRGELKAVSGSMRVGRAGLQHLVLVQQDPKLIHEFEANAVPKRFGTRFLGNVNVSFYSSSARAAAPTLYSPLFTGRATAPHHHTTTGLPRGPPAIPHQP